MYKRRHDNTIVREADGAVIPMDEANQDYLAFMDWSKTHTVPKDKPPMAPPAPPTFVDQLQLALDDEAVLGKLRSRLGRP